MIRPEFLAGICARVHRVYRASVSLVTQTLNATYIHVIRGGRKLRFCFSLRETVKANNAL
jgi:hypothetical protein